MLHHTQGEETNRETQYLSESEAQQVIGLWAEREPERESRRGQTTVRDLAEGLQVSEAEVRAMLEEIRDRREAEAMSIRQAEEVVFRSRHGVPVFVVLAAIAAILLIMGIATVRVSSSPPVVPPAPDPAVAVPITPAPEVPPRSTGATAEAPAAPSAR
jgi:hypothetical protein